jgi:hypothetical protein
MKKSHEKCDQGRNAYYCLNGLLQTVESSFIPEQWRIVESIIDTIYHFRFPVINIYI